MAVLGVAAPAHALIIVPTFDSTVTSLAYAAQVESAVNYAIGQYDTLFADPITVNIKIMASTDPNVLGENTSSLLTSTMGNGYSYSQVRTALIADKSTANDTTALASLGATDPTAGGAFFIPIAQAQAIGLDSATDTRLRRHVHVRHHGDLHLRSEQPQHRRGL